MTASDLQMDAPLVFTDAAAAQVRKLVAQEDNPDLKLRVFVTGGGCSGFQYGFEFDEQINDDDFRIDKGDVSVVIDAMSMQYLQGAQIGFQEDLTGAQFVVSNPNAATTCGCGASFSV